MNANAQRALFAPEVEQIANAVLYEGYLLYPYRPSTKNRQRWTIGGVWPAEWCAAQNCGDAAAVAAECLLLAEPQAELSVCVRFLQLVDRRVGRLLTPVARLSDADKLEYELVPSLQVGSKRLHAWQEAVEREINLGTLSVAELAQPRVVGFSFARSENVETVSNGEGPVEAVLLRQQQTLAGCVRLQAESVQPGVYCISIRIENNSRCPAATSGARAEAQLQSLASAHAILHASGGRFASLVDPPPAYQTQTSACSQQGLWPVLVGRPQAADTMLAAPIILYDYPQIAPESPGDLFDGTEIDEILSLRIMTLSEDEKQLARAIDERARALLERTDKLAPEELAALHGTRRDLRPAMEDDENAAIR